MVKSKILFSVILPFQKFDNFLSNAIQSVLSQKYQNFELLIVGSQSLSIKRNLKENFDQRVKFFNCNLNSGGGYNARNLAIQKARGDWLTFLDSDDIWEPNHLSEMLKMITMYPNSALVCSRWLNAGFNLKTKIKGVRPNKEDYGEISYIEYLKSIRSGSDFFNTNVVCLKSKFIDKKNCFPNYQKGCLSSGDGVFWLRYILSNKDKTIAWSSKVTAIYWQYDNKNRASLSGRYITDNCYINFLIKICLNKNQLNNNELNLLKSILSAKCGSRLFRIKIDENFTIDEFGFYMKYVKIFSKYGFLLKIKYFYFFLLNVFNLN